MRGGLKRTTITYIMVSVISLLVIGSVFIAAFIISVSGIKKNYAADLQEARAEISSNQRMVYKAVGDIAAGQPITSDKVENVKVFSSMEQALYMDAQDVGKVALIDIAAGTQILGSMLTEETVSGDIREVEYGVIMINSNVVDNDYVDIRIMFPNGEDYVILPKKVIKGVTMDAGTCYLWLTEEEILRMASATVDAHLYEGSKIYTTKYVEPTLQEASKVTYEPSVSTLLLIKDNPNILATATSALSQQVRKAMENRLAESYGTNVQDISWALSPNTPATTPSEGENATIPEDDAAVTPTPAPENDIPVVLQKDNQATYQDELEQKEADIDYGP